MKVRIEQNFVQYKELHSHSLLDSGDSDDSEDLEYTHVELRDWTTRKGLGESPGIRNIEFLGIGYDGLRGNPHGGISSELDPGKWN